MSVMFDNGVQHSLFLEVECFPKDCLERPVPWFTLSYEREQIILSSFYGLCYDEYRWEYENFDTVLKKFFVAVCHPFNKFIMI